MTNRREREKNFGNLEIPHPQRKGPLAKGGYKRYKKKGTMQ